MIEYYPTSYSNNLTSLYGILLKIVDDAGHPTGTFSYKEWEILLKELGFNISFTYDKNYDYFESMLIPEDELIMLKLKYNITDI